MNIVLIHHQAIEIFELQRLVVVLAVQSILYLGHEGGQCLVVIDNHLEHMQMM